MTGAPADRPAGRSAPAHAPAGGGRPPSGTGSASSAAGSTRPRQAAAGAPHAAADAGLHPGGRDHGGGLDAAVARWGGSRADWLDLSTGINPLPYPVAGIPDDGWTALPDRGAADALDAAARAFWSVPPEADILAAPGASALIARMPEALAVDREGRGGAGGLSIRGPDDARIVAIPGPTYNEHAAAFAARGWQVRQAGGEGARAQVIVHPNNPDGRLWGADDLVAPRVVIDESFCDVAPDRSLIALAARPGTVVLKSFGKFWGLAGLRLGFAIGDPVIVAALREALGPWPVSGPALHIGATALRDEGWAHATRARLARDSARLDALMQARGARVVGGTTLFRLYDTAPEDGAPDDGAPAAGAPDGMAPDGRAAARAGHPAREWQERLARGHVWSRIFPYSDRWLRLGLPHPDRWDRLSAALA